MRFPEQLAMACLAVSLAGSIAPAQFFEFEKPLDNRLFVRVPPYLGPSHVVVANLNDDGLDDLVLTGDMETAFIAMLNGGNGRFNYQGTFGDPVFSASHGLGVGDNRQHAFHHGLGGIVGAQAALERLGHAEDSHQAAAETAGVRAANATGGVTGKAPCPGLRCSGRWGPGAPPAGVCRRGSA